MGSARGKQPLGIGTSSPKPLTQPPERGEGLEVETLPIVIKFIFYA